MLIGKKVFTRSEIEQRIGSIAQIGGTRHYELAEGNTRGVGAIDFDTGSEFHFTLLPDRGMDISGASYQGINLVYHINPGFPLLDEGSELVCSSRKCEPKNEHSRKAMQDMQKFSSPVAGFEEQNFLHTMLADKDGYGYAAMINSELAGGLGLSVKFPIANLPFLSEWKMMGQGDYVVGIEPVNTKLHSRAVLRREKALPVLHAGEKREMQVEIGVLDGKDEIDSFLSMVGSITGENE